MGSLHLLLSPDIVHLLTEMTTGLIEDLDQRRQSLFHPQNHGRPINQQDYVKIVPQVTDHLQRQKLSDNLFSLNSIHSPETDLHSITRSQDEEDQTYFSIRSSLDEDLLPLDIPPAMSIARSDGINIPLRDPGNQLSSIASSGTPPNILLSRGSPLTPNSTLPISPHYTPTHVSVPREPFVSKPLTDCNKFVVKIGGISLALLHVSITSLYQLPDAQVNELNEYLPEGRTANELSTHTQLALLYFHRLDKLTEQSGLNYITGTFLMDKLTKFAYAIPNDHLRLHISGLNAEVQISALRTEASLSVNGANLSECLFDNPADLAPTGPFDALRVTEVLDSKYTINHTQVLKFHSSPERSDPCISVRFLFSQEQRKIENLSIPKSPLLSLSDLNISTLPFTLVLDITILNRIHALLQPDMQASSYNQWSTSINYKSVFQSVHQSISTQRQVLFQNTVDESNVITERQTSLYFKSPSIAIICKIPILEKKACQDAGLWWKPSLRQESFLISSNNVRASFLDGSLQKQDQLVTILADDLSISLRESASSLPIKLILLGTRLGGPSSSNCPSVTLRLKEEPSSLLGDSVNIHVPLDPAPNDTTNITDSVYVQSGQQTASPFSSKKYVHNQEELILPGNQREMEEFETDTKLNSLHGLEINLPVVKMHIPSKEILQILVNRLTELINWNSVPTQSFQTESVDPKKISPHLLSSSPLVPLHHLYIAQENGERHNYESDEDEFSLNSSPGTVKNSSATRQANSLSTLSLSVNIDNIVITAITRVQEEVSESGPDSPLIDHGPVTLIQDIDEPIGECMLQVSYLKFFHVTGYTGNDTLSYDSLFVKRAQLSHRGLLHEEPYSCVDTPNRPISPDTLPVLIYCSDHLSTLSPGLYNPKQTQYDKSPCISLAIRTKQDPSSQSKSITMSLLLTGLAMRHMFVPSYLHCFTQLGDLFSLGNNEIGTETSLKEESIRNRTKPSPVLFTLYTHLKECGIDYRPLHMPVNTFITISSFCFSSNIVSGAPTSMQRMLLEDVALYLSQKKFKGSPNLKEDYFCAMDLGLLELTLRLASEGISKIPQVDLSVSSNTLHIYTCADAIITLRDLLLYITNNGDYATPSVARNSSVSTTKPFDALPPSQTEKDPISSLTHSITGQLIDAIEDCVIDLDDEVVNSCQQESTPSMKQKPRTKLHSDSNETLKVLHTEDGMEISFSKSQPKIQTPTGLRPNSLTNPLSMSISGDFSSQLSSLDEDDGFTLLSDPKISQIVPEVRGLLDINEKIRVIENHFTIPDITTSDQLQPPSHYPCPTQRYSLKDLNIVWHLYGGSDFEYSRQKDKSTNKNTFPVMSPTVRFSDTSSPLYKDDGLTQLSIVRRPTDTDPQKVKTAVNPTTNKNWKALGGPGRDPHDLMIIKLYKVKLQHEVYPPTAEQCSRFVLLVNDIEVLDKLKSSSINKFLHVFTSEAMPRPTHANILTIKALMSRLDPEIPDNEEASIKISLLPMKLNIDQDALLMIKEFFTKILETKPISFPAPPFLPTSSIPPVSSLTPQSQSRPVYIRSFSFYPDVPIRVDYQAKHRLHMDQGTITGLLLSLTDLNCSEIKLKKLSSRKGFLGYDKLLEYVITEWLTDIKSYQLPRIIGGVGPMYYITQLAQGTVDLVRLPWQQYRQDGRIIWGLQQGATSFSSSTAMATLELANRVVVTIQSVAETIYELISPNYLIYGDSHLLPDRPQDLREGLTHAYDAVSFGVSNTATNMYNTAVDDKDFSYSRAVTGVIKQIPGSVIMPVIIASKATSSVLGGAKNQLMPDARRETEQKYKNVKNNK
ncbi:Autophagy-related protein 2-like protein B [Oopsacas minuta]|uniref:Autophagy-related protein 2 n=1 Tax=Oopsacas minuta TaxID=111878 RepID=A0AAV7K9M2_9METZ|nr:Autophagy-related protein 2-like protein B [Oopsacas minuta]